MRYTDDLSRFFTHVEPGLCWIWTGSLNADGYGNFHANKRTYLAHRWLWLTLVGALAKGLVLDHLCNVPACVNPDHLEPVTQAENLRRARRKPLAPTCGEGHEFTLANTIIRKDGMRFCRACGNRRSREYRARRKARSS